MEQDPYLSDVIRLTKEWKSQRKISEELGIWRTMVRWRQEKMNKVEKEMIEQGFSKDNWSVAWLKTDWLSILAKNTFDVDFDAKMQEITDEMKKYAPKYPILKRQKHKDWHLLVIDPADVHIGKLAMMDETGNEYNIDIAIDRVLQGVEEAIQRSEPYHIDKVLLVIGNDILHVDTPYRKTTAGTPQDTTSQWWHAYHKAKELYIKVIERLLTIADVHIIYNPSNHDYTNGFFLADSIASWFHNCKNTIFETSIQHRKYFTYGENLIGTTHGDGAREQDLVYLMANESKHWSNTEHRYWYLHHIHHHKKIKYQSWKDYIGCTLEYLRSPSGTDAWSYKSWYTSKHAMDSFIHHKEHWQVAKFTTYF